MTPRRAIRDDARGATIVELAFALPVLVMLMVGILQCGIVLHATGGMRHSLGEGVRYARVYRDATADEVLARIRSHYSGIKAENVKSLTFTRGTTASGAEFARASMTYAPSLVIPFVPASAITLSQTKLIYLPE